ncbi:gatA [Symbiodinium microadriaticum]|nr:gatA [Symbiodinium microadriaticum]
MGQSDLQTLDATAWLEKLSAGEITARDLLERHIDQIEKVNPALNAVVAFDFDRARKAADESDKARAAGKDLGPLHGLPMTIKDALEVAGLVTTGGGPEYKDHIPTANAAVVQRVIDAGAIVIGKTNVPYMSGDLQTYNDVYGVTSNPWDTARIPGGSSGGAAASLAAGMTTLEIGSDIGGSIRCPAHYCGVCGLKPSLAIVSKRGHIPGPPGSLSEDDLSVVGPMARSIRDLQLLFPILAGPDGLEAKGWQLALPPARTTDVKQMRIALWPDDAYSSVSTDTKRLLNDMADKLEAAGATVDRDPPMPCNLEDIAKLYTPLLGSIVLAGLPTEIKEAMAAAAAEAPEGDNSFPVLQGKGAMMSAAQRSVYSELRAQMQQKWETFFKSYDAVLMPNSPDAAFEKNHETPFPARIVEVDGKARSYADFIAWTGPAILLGLPAASVPMGQSEAGLPINAQVMAPYLEDNTALAIAAVVEDLAGPFKAPDVSAL